VPEAESGSVTTAFVLSGGGSHGAVQVGMLLALEESGVRPDLIVGTSVGSINAAFMASRPYPGAAEELATLWRSLEHRDLPDQSAAGTGRAARAAQPRGQSQVPEPARGSFGAVR
jgi:predicted acylesterase/phospholipase RssA